jgi:hypothetical protein
MTFTKNGKMKKVNDYDIYYKEISKDTFEGDWPFKVDNGILANNLGAIIFISPRNKSYAINGVAKDRFKRYRSIKRIHKRGSNGSFVPVSDIIMEGLKLNPNYK